MPKLQRSKSLNDLRDKVNLPLLDVFKSNSPLWTTLTTLVKVKQYVTFSQLLCIAKHVPVQRLYLWILERNDVIAFEFLHRYVEQSNHSYYEMLPGVSLQWSDPYHEFEPPKHVFQVRLLFLCLEHECLAIFSRILPSCKTALQQCEALAIGITLEKLPTHEIYRTIFCRLMDYLHEIDSNLYFSLARLIVDRLMPSYRQQREWIYTSDFWMHMYLHYPTWKDQRAYYLTYSRTKEIYPHYCRIYPKIFQKFCTKNLSPDTLHLIGEYAVQSYEDFSFQLWNGVTC